MIVEDGSVPPDSGSNQWISPNDAVTAAAKFYGSRLVAKEALADLLMDGAVSARAQKVWSSDVRDLNEAWRSRHDVEAVAEVTLTARDWMDSEDWLADLKRWRWPQERFVLTTSKKPKKWRFLEGVRFSATDLNEVLGTTDAEPRMPKRGPNPDIQKWARFWMAAVELGANGKLVRAKLQTKAQLRDQLKIGMGNPPFGNRHIDPWVDEIWEKFVELN